MESPEDTRKSGYSVTWQGLLPLASVDIAELARTAGAVPEMLSEEVDGNG